MRAGCTPYRGIAGQATRVETPRLLASMRPRWAHGHHDRRGKDSRRIERFQTHARDLAANLGLELQVKFHDHFLPTTNHPSATCILRQACAPTPMLEPTYPFRWSEDFGLFTQHTPGTLFGLGAGQKQPPLHDPNYDFPDELIEIGVETLLQICRHQKPSSPTSQTNSQRNSQTNSQHRPA